MPTTKKKPRSNLARIIKQKGMTRYGLAVKLGCEPSYIYKLCKQQIEPKVRRGVAIAKILGVDPHRIWPVGAGR